MGENWRGLAEMKANFEANLEALRSRAGDLADQLGATADDGWRVAIDGDRIVLGRDSGAGVEPLANPVTPASARQIASKLYPSGQCTEPVMVAGIDQGWLWKAIFDLPVNTPRTPGHRPPLYFLARDLERLRVVLHLHDWAAMLADPRVQIFAGADAVEQARRSMIARAHVPWPKLCVTVDPAIWPPGVSVDSLWQDAHRAATARMHQLSGQIEAVYAGTEPTALAARLRGQRLRVMGITSLFTTFLQYSMRDWLDAMARMGHETRLVMEQQPHEIANPVYFAEAVAEFRPDLILMIDHYRNEIAGLPKSIPCVMWVQDNLPNIFSASAGSAQGPRDYCVGFGRLALRDLGYPERRFMPAQVGVNELRFAPRDLSESEMQRYGCDLSFVSHASAPATAILTEQLGRADAGGRKVLIEVFERMRAVYDKGGFITQPAVIRGMLDEALSRHRARLDEPAKRGLLDFYNQRINNALFRHQALSWAADLGVNLHLYGRGWDSNPRFARFARGIADNQAQLAIIYQASRINLQITPYGAVHQRMLDGLAAGGFFLVRRCPGDLVEPIYRRIYEWCAANRIGDDAGLRRAATPEISRMLEEVRGLLQVDPFEMAGSFIDVLRLAHDGGYIRSAASIWPEFGQVSFGSADELRKKVTEHLATPQERRRIAMSMRRPVLERLSYASISRRLLEFIADDLERDAAPAEVAA